MAQFGVILGVDDTDECSGDDLMADNGADVEAVVPLATEFDCDSFFAKKKKRIMSRVTVWKSSCLL